MSRDIWKKNILTMLIIASVMISPIYGEMELNAENPGPFFSISILAPNTNPARTQWATLMVE